MKAAVFKTVGKPMAIENVPDPTPQTNDLVIQVKRCGICGTDLHSTDNHETALPKNTILGHEFVGEVVALGKSAKNYGWQEGDRVTGMPFVSCGNCEPCRYGRPFECVTKEIIGMDIGGGFAEYMRLDSNNSIKLPQTISWDEGALIEPMAVGLHAVRQTSRKLGGQRVLIIGAGPVGLATAYWCRFFGARNVVVSEFDDFRRESALKFGATEVINGAKENVTSEFQRLSGGAPDVIFECVGVPGLIGECIEQAKFGSEIVVVGFCLNPDTIVPGLAVMKEISMRFAIAYHKKDYEFISQLMANDRIDIAHMCSGVVGFDTFAEMFESLRSPNDHCKVLLNPFG